MTKIEIVSDLSNGYKGTLPCVRLSSNTAEKAVFFCRSEKVKKITGCGKNKLFFLFWFMMGLLKEQNKICLKIS